MGVVYKLKQEVIDFIVTEKRNSPNLSCRKLADLAKEKFQVEVSKSSVNSVIKQASLSSPVGRRSDSPSKTKQFKIPKEKKDELLSLTQPSLLEHKDIDAAFIPVIVPETPVVPEIEKQLPPQEPLPAIPLPEPPPELPIPPELLTPPSIPGQPVDQAELVVPSETEEVPKEKSEEQLEEQTEGQPEEQPEEERPHLNLEPLAETPPQLDEVPPLTESIKEAPPEPIIEPQQTDAEAPPPPPVIEEKAVPVEPVAEKPAASPPAMQPSPEEILPEPPPEDIQIKPFEKPQKAISILDGMGCFFLKAAEWELTSSPIPGGLLRKHGKYFSPLTNDMGEALLFAGAFGIQSLENLRSYTKTGLFSLNNFPKAPDYNEFEKLLRNIPSPKAVSSALAFEYSQIFSEVGYFRITLADGAQICIDAQQHSLWPSLDTPSNFSIPLNRALDVLSENFVSNVRPVILLAAPGIKSFGKIFFDLMTAFENSIERPIVQMAIHDIDRNEIAKFSTVPSKRRHFIAGAWPEQEEFSHLTGQDPRHVKSCVVPEINREVFYSEFKTSLGQQIIGQGVGVRVFLLRESAEGWPFLAIVTNIPNEKMPSSDVISAYLGRWPNFKEGYDDFLAKSQKASFGTMSNISSSDRVPLLEGKGYFNILDKPNLWQDMQFLLSSLSRYCQRRFFPAHYESLEFVDLKERFYGLEGVVERSMGLITVVLHPSPGFLHRNDLEYAVRRLNESHIRDFSGAKLTMTISG